MILELNVRMKDSVFDELFPSQVYPTYMASLVLTICWDSIFASATMLFPLSCSGSSIGARLVLDEINGYVGIMLAFSRSVIERDSGACVLAMSPSPRLCHRVRHGLVYCLAAIDPKSDLVRYWFIKIGNRWVP